MPLKKPDLAAVIPAALKGENAVIKAPTLALLVVALIGIGGCVYCYLDNEAYRSAATASTDAFKKATDQNRVLTGQIEALQAELDAAKSVLGQRELELLKLKGGELPPPSTAASPETPPAAEAGSAAH